jgi:hypothetical protein
MMIQQMRKFGDKGVHWMYSVRECENRSIELWWCMYSVHIHIYSSTSRFISSIQLKNECVESHYYIYIYIEECNRHGGVL